MVYYRKLFKKINFLILKTKKENKKMISCCLSSVPVIACMLAQPLWYPIERICFGALCPPNDILSLFETGSQILCCGIPPAFHLTVANTCLQAVANVAPCACINQMGNTTATTALSIVNSCCSTTWIANIYSAWCGFIASACQSYSPIVFFNGVVATCSNFCSSICQGTSPFFMAQCMLARILAPIQNLTVGCCGGQWLTPVADTFANYLANPFCGCSSGTKCGLPPPELMTLPIVG
jgi:hypothetical protein